jgi:hypothetical protein
VLPGHDIFQAGHIREEADVLKGARDSVRNDLVGLSPGYPGILEMHIPVLRLVYSRYYIEHRGLACPVGADEAQDLSFMDG